MCSSDLRDLQQTRIRAPEFQVHHQGRIGIGHDGSPLSAPGAPASCTSPGPSSRSNRRHDRPCGRTSPRCPAAGTTVWWCFGPSQSSCAARQASMRFVSELPSAAIRVFIGTPFKSLAAVSQAPFSRTLSKIKDAAAGPREDDSALSRELRMTDRCILFIQRHPDPDEGHLTPCALARRSG